MDASKRKLRKYTLMTVVVLSLTWNAVVAAAIQNALKCSSGHIQSHWQWEVGSVTLRPSETTENEHTYTYPEKENGPYKLWPLDKYGRLSKTKVQNVRELELETDIFFNHELPHTVCIVLRLKHFESGEPVFNKSEKYPKIKYVQWAFIIRKEIHEVEGPIILEVLFSQTRPGKLEKAELFRLEAFVPRSGGEMELTVIEPVIALEMGE